MANNSQELAFLPAALEIQDRPPSPIGSAIIWTIIVLFAVAVVWAFFGQLDIVAVAQGKIVPQGRSKVVSCHQDDDSTGVHRLSFMHSFDVTEDI